MALLIDLLMRVLAVVVWLAAVMCVGMAALVLLGVSAVVWMHGDMAQLGVSVRPVVVIAGMCGIIWAAGWGVLSTHAPHYLPSIRDSVRALAMKISWIMGGGAVVGALIVGVVHVYAHVTAI